MQIFCLSDPHYGRDMSRFGPVWVDHEKKIAEHWRQTVAEGDLVLIPGDISWATTTKSTLLHLSAIDSLPGRKIISPGNHDRWWKKTEHIALPTITFLKDEHLPLGDSWTLAATMGWEQPESPWWKESEMREDFEAACMALERTLREAEGDRPNTKILLMIHYPPRWQHADTPTAFEEIIARYPVELVVYGHIHGDDLKMAHNGPMEVFSSTIRYENASVDRTNMTPILVAEISVS